ncbi:histone-lysine N-methyltransferase SETMAR [Trichonephila clavipes]|nr:histone-lysine N-methyltransferase SETMAR [Trichonephila clavipes]
MTMRVRVHNCVRRDVDGDASPTGGVCLFTSNLNPSNVVTLHTSLQDVAVRIHIRSLVTVCGVYLPPNDVVPQLRFAKFRSGNFDVEDAPRSGRPVEADKDAIKALVDANWRITTREIGLRLNLSNSTVYDHLKGLGLSSKLDVWVPHVLTERNLCRRIDVCDSLLKRHENDPFLKRIITVDEKGHGAKKMNRLKPFPKPIFTKKEVYCHQLDKLNDALEQKRSELINRKGVVFHQDNARPYTSLVTRQKLLQFQWDTMPHPPYYPDLAP